MQDATQLQRAVAAKPFQPVSVMFYFLLASD
jgi:hypothetical protein